MASLRLVFLISLLLLVGWTGLGAQDTRVVSEPRIPGTCKVLTADLTPHAGTLPDAIERHYRDTDRLEKAMRHCPAGSAVVLAAGESGKSVFLVGPVRMSAGVTIVVDAQVAVWGSRDPRNYDVAPGSCGIVGERGPGCKPLFIAQDAPHAGIMGDGVIDGRGGARLLLAGGKEGETWWELAHRAKVEDSNQAVSRLLVVRHSDDFTLYRVTLRNSPNCHVSVEATNGFTAWGVKIDAPKWARDTDGIDAQAGSTNVTIAGSWIRAGDDNIAPRAGEGTGAVSHVTVRDTHFYDGHGFGFGSQTVGGISHIAVMNLSIDGSDNGLRIKSDRSRGGVVEDVQFENVCMRNVANPIVLNPFSTNFAGDRIPVYRGIVLDNVHALTPGQVTMRGLDAGHVLDATLINVTVSGVKTDEVNTQFAVFGVRGGNLELKGEDVVVHGTAHGAVPGFAGPISCANAFPAFPENTSAPASAEMIPPADETFYVAADGTGDYSSVQAAVDKVPATGGLVLVAPGVYRERVVIKQAHVTLKSANPDPAKTVIVYDLSKGTRGPTQGPSQGSATVRVTGDDFAAENLTFANDFNRTHRQEPQGSQARALALYGDRNVLRNVHVLGNQGTLYLGAKNCRDASGNNCEPGRTYVSRSLISGNVDFIYGDGTAYFDDCEIRSTPYAEGFVTAQGKHYPKQESLFVFRQVRLTAEPGVTNVFLGRPWRDDAAVVFLESQLGAHIDAAGFREWHPGETHRLETAFYRTWRMSGPGAKLWAKQLTDAEAAHYSPQEVLGGKDRWNPLGVP